MLDPEQISEPKLVRIEWIDSRRPTQEWQWLRSAVEIDAPTIKSVGWMISQTDTLSREDDRILLAAHMSQPDDGGDRQANGIMAIPSRSVINICYLVDAGSLGAEKRQGCEPGATNA